MSGVRGPNGEELVLVFDHDGLIAAEDAADRPIKDVVEGAMSGRMGHIGALLYGGLRRNHPKLQLRDARDIVERARLGEMSEALIEGLFRALEKAMPKRDEEADPQTAPGNGTGTPSSGSGAKKGSPRKASAS